MSVHAQLIPSRSNICTVKSGNAAPTHERTIVFAENADALYCRYVSTRYERNALKTSAMLAPIGTVASAGTIQWMLDLAVQPVRNRPMGRKIVPGTIDAIRQ